MVPRRTIRDTEVMVDLIAVHGDITAQPVDAIVNAANNRMRGGGGVDGAIHRAGGPAILADCIARFPDGLATGDAGWTTAGELPARWVIHTVGPNHSAGERDRELLVSCYRRALEVAEERGARSVAFPLISAGVYGWPKADAVAAAVETIAASGTRAEVRIVAFDTETHARVRAAVLLRVSPPVRDDSVGALFDRGVLQWGLRGDPYLWRELRARFADTPLPSSALELKRVLTDAAQDVVGVDLRATSDPVHLAAYDPGHGMSAGLVSPAWWTGTGIPILVDRFEAATRPSA